jgi:Response regulator containing CheY-like receiver domain and AraC-type DNA-binding domain
MMRKLIKLVIADDNREFCELLKEFIAQQDDLALAGVANNGLEALELIEQHSPDIVVLDIIMPHLDGIGVLERLASGSFSQRPRVIMLTAFGQETVTQRAVELGAD